MPSDRHALYLECTENGMPGSFGVPAGVEARAAECNEDRRGRDGQAPILAASDRCSAVLQGRVEQPERRARPG